MPRPKGKAIISLKGNAKNFLNIYRRTYAALRCARSYLTITSRNLLPE